MILRMKLFKTNEPNSKLEATIFPKRGIAKFVRTPVMSGVVSGHFLYLHSHAHLPSSIKAYGLKATQAAVARFHPKIASLLPISVSGLVKYNRKGSTSLLYSLQNRTHLGLLMEAQCLDDVVEMKTTPDSATIFTKRAIKKGKIAVPVPLYIAHRPNKDSCSLENGECSWGAVGELINSNKCIGHADSSLLLCTLLISSFRLAENPNVEYQWSSWNSRNGEGHKLSPEEARKVSVCG
jgi:hypothetical protein